MFEKVFDPSVKDSVIVACKSCYSEKQCYKPESYTETKIVIPTFGFMYRYTTTYFKCKNMTVHCQTQS